MKKKHTTGGMKTSAKNEGGASLAKRGNMAYGRGGEGAKHQKR